MGTKELTLSGFSKVEVTSVVEVELFRSGSYSVNITADDKIIKHIACKQKDDTLKVGLKPTACFAPWWRKPGMKVSIGMPELTGLRLSGAAHGKVNGFNSSKDLEIKLSGASMLSVRDVSSGDTKIEISGASQASGNIKISGNMQIDLSGASKLDFSGSANDILVKASGASHADLKSLAANNGSFNISGASSAGVNLKGILDAKLSGASKLNYIGEPTLGSVKTSGASNIEKI
jgi:hypothetical protein